MPEENVTRRRHALLVDVTQAASESAAWSTNSTYRWSPGSAEAATPWSAGQSCSKRSSRNG
jgi:hypothetical protein